MADSKDTTSFFRKVVKFVANPATEWHDLGAAPPESRENELARTELKSMIERKRRNDFVRKREFDMLRKVRREGLTSEQLAALGGSSRLDDSEGRMPEPNARIGGMKAKIDEIEQQMVGEGDAARARQSAARANRGAAAAVPLGEPRKTPPAAPAPARTASTAGAPSSAGASSAARPPDSAVGMTMSAGMAPPPELAFHATTFGAPDDPAAARYPADAPPTQAPETSEGLHDPDLDEAVIAFANADFDPCEQALLALTGAGGARERHAETWLVLFDLYRAIGQQSKFDTLAVDYAHQFGWSAPQWFSLPRMVSEAAEEERPRASRIDGQVGWVCPSVVDVDAVGRLRSLTLQMPLPWVFDWSALHGIDAEACAQLSELFRGWIGQKLDMRWLGGDRLFGVLTEAAPVGVRDADPAYWQLRLDALRMANRPDQFDEAAIDYCVTYEVSPPSWERAECRVRVSGSRHSTLAHAPSVLGEVSTSFVESQLADETGARQSANVELSGQLMGDIGAVLAKMTAELGGATRVVVSCTRLIRVDFIAAGDLLNWVLSQRTANRRVSFVEAHRLLALFFGAMGIDEHATIKVKIL